MTQATRKIGISQENENLSCTCGHTKFWHANFGKANCDQCSCQKFVDACAAQSVRPHIPIASLDEIASYERPSRTKAEQWADDYLSKPQDFHPPEWQRWLIEKYGLNVRIGESLLAAMFEAYAAQPTRASMETKIESMMLATEPCPDCGSGRHRNCEPTPVHTRLTAEQLAQKFHEAYERLAPQFSYETRKASAKPWTEVPENNRKLMTAVCAEILEALREKIL